MTPSPAAPRPSRADNQSRSGRTAGPTKKRGKTLKDHVAQRIALEIARRGLSQTEASHEMTRATKVSVAPSQISLCVTGKLDGFSLERLLTMATGLGVDATVVLERQTSGVRGRLMVVQR